MSKTDTGTGRKDSTDSAESSTHSSDAPINSYKQQSILVNYHLDRNNLSVNFWVNSGQRADTEVAGGGQGDHTTAHEVILQAMLSSTDFIGISGAIGNFGKFGTNLLQGDQKDKFDKIAGIPPKVHSRTVRKSMIADLKKAIKDDGSAKYTQEEISRADQEMKYAKIDQLASHLCQLSSFFLVGVQQDESTAFYSKGRLEKNPNEGNIVKAAARGLVMLDKLCALCEIDIGGDEGKKIFESRLKIFTDSLGKKQDGESEEAHIMRYGMNRFFAPQNAASDGGTKADKILEKISREANPQQQKAILESLRDEALSNGDQIAELIGNLFDYQRVVKFDLDKAVELTATEKKKTSVEQEQIKQEKIKECFNDKKSRAHEFKFDNQQIGSKTIKVATIARTNHLALIGIAAKHLDFTEIAFPNLNKQLDQTKQKDVVTEAFLQKQVCEKQGWHEEQYSKAGKSFALDAEYLRTGIDTKKQKKVADASKSTGSAL
jgi:hypothetical protein